MCNTMDQEMMQLKEELKELVQKGQHIIQKMEGGMMGQRMYGMRSNQSPGFGGYNGSNSSNGGGNGSGFGQREPWMQPGFPQQIPPQMQQQGFPQQGFPQYPPQYPQQDMMQQMNPLWFL